MSIEELTPWLSLVQASFHFLKFRMSQVFPRGSEEDEMVHEVGVISVCLFQQRCGSLCGRERPDVDRADAKASEGVVRLVVKVILLVLLLVGLPLLGIVIAGQPLDRYLEFPPRTRYVQHAPFSWTVFIALALCNCGVGRPFCCPHGYVTPHA